MFVLFERDPRSGPPGLVEEALAAYGPGARQEFQTALEHAIGSRGPENLKLSGNLHSGRPITHRVRIWPSVQGETVTRVDVLVQELAAPRNLGDATAGGAMLLAGKVPHDINNAIAAVCGDAESLRLTTDADARGALVECMIEDAIRAAKVTRECMNLAQQRVHEAVSLKPMFLKLAERYTANKSPPIAMHVDVGQDPLVLHCVEDELRSVVENLCKNAVEAMHHAETRELSIIAHDAAFGDPPDGISVGAVRLNQPYVAIAVHDTGPGMPSEVRDKIIRFERYSTKGKGGSGLGLPGILTLVVTVIGGAVGIHAVPGRGTTITVYWPRNEEASA